MTHKNRAFFIFSILIIYTVSSQAGDTQQKSHWLWHYFAPISWFFGYTIQAPKTTSEPVTHTPDLQYVPIISPQEESDLKQRVRALVRKEIRRESPIFHQNQLTSKDIANMIFLFGTDSEQRKNFKREIE